MGDEAGMEQFTLVCSPLPLVAETGFQAFGQYRREAEFKSCISATFESSAVDTSLLLPYVARVDVPE